MLSFAREVDGTFTPSASITNIRLSIEGGPTLHEFPLQLVDLGTLEGNPDADGRSKLYEYSMGGDPHDEGYVGAQAVFEESASSGEYFYPRRWGYVEAYF